MEALIEVLFEFLLEILLALLQMVGELLLGLLGEVLVHGLQRVGAWFGWSGMLRPESRTAASKGANTPAVPVRRWFVAPWWPVLGHAAAGMLVGVASLLWLPHLLVRTEWLRVLNVLVTPLAAGALMGLWGGWRRRHGLPVLRVDAFATAYVFAFCMAAVRFFGGV